MQFGLQKQYQAEYDELEKTVVRERHARRYAIGPVYGPNPLYERELITDRMVDMFCPNGKINWLKLLLNIGRLAAQIFWLFKIKG